MGERQPPYVLNPLAVELIAGRTLSDEERRKLNDLHQRPLISKETQPTSSPGVNLPKTA